MTFRCVEVFYISLFFFKAAYYIVALFQYFIGNQIIRGKGGSNDHKNVYPMLSVLKKIININHFAFSKSVLQREMLNLNLEWIVKANTAGCMQLPGAEGNGK